MLWASSQLQQGCCSGNRWDRKSHNDGPFQLSFLGYESRKERDNDLEERERYVEENSVELVETESLWARDNQ